MSETLLEHDGTYLTRFYDRRGVCFQITEPGVQPDGCRFVQLTMDQMERIVIAYRNRPDITGETPVAPAPASPRDCACYEKAQKRGDHTFTLVGQDRTSPRVIAFWILENMENAPAEKLRCALEDALAMRDTHKRKWAD